MPKGDISVAQLDQAEAALQEAKASEDPTRIKEASHALASLRSAFRQQETNAGRRAPGVGVGPGDANPTPPTLATGA